MTGIHAFVTNTFVQHILGYRGDQCQDDIDDCIPNNCLNGASCTDTGPNSFTCMCAGTGYEGTLCGSPEDDCDSSPCYNSGVCVDAHLAYSCTCTGTGFEGTSENETSLLTE